MNRNKLCLKVILLFLGGYFLIDITWNSIYYKDLFVERISVKGPSIEESLTKTTSKFVPKKVNIQSNETFDDLLNFSKKNKFPNGIPKILHYNYKSKMVPSQYVPLVKHCMEINPSVNFVFWTDVTSLSLIKNYFPKDFNIYKSYLQTNSQPLKKSDLIRYFILYYFGGIYMDLDTRCQRNLEEVMKEGSCILSREAEVQTRILHNIEFSAMNSFMACIPRHRFFSFIISKIKRDDNSEILRLTGPKFLTNIFIQYNASLTKNDIKNSYKYVTIPSSDHFSSLISDYLKGPCENPKGKWSLIGCKDLEAYKRVMKEKISKAVVVHLFLHLGYSENSKDIKTLEDVSKVKPLKIII